MDTNRDLLYLTALLHDIGKFSQRADPKGITQSDFIPDRIRDMISSFCPRKQDQNKHTHLHSLYTAAFIENFQQTFQKFISANYSQIQDLDTFIKLAASHHDPHSYFERLIQKADHYSSGSDRTEKEGITEEQEAKGKGAFKNTRMVSIFEGIFQEKPHYQYRLPVNTINFERNSYFPQTEYEANPDYKTLWDRFESDVALISSNNPRIYAETLLQVLQKYTVNVPSSTIHLPDVSLYDHLKTTAAFTVCLYDFMKAEDKQTIDKNDSPVLLIGGDLSGIQKFIYDIISKYAAKNLKGRSFYLELLVNSVIKQILHELDLYQANIVYASGGGFYLLAPNTQEIKEKLENLEQTISRKIFKSHGESLYLAIDWEPNTEKQILNKEIDSRWKILIEKVNQKKRQKYRYDLIDKYDEFFTPSGVGAEQARDAITGEEILEKDSWEYLEKGEDTKIKELTNDQIMLGKTLKNAVYWLTTDTKIKELKAFDPAYLGVYHYLLTREELKQIDWNQIKNNSFNQIKLINEVDFHERNIATNDLIWGFDL